MASRKPEAPGLLEFTARREDLLAELQLVKSAAEKKTTIPILANVLLEAHAESVTLTASDLEIVIQSTFPAKVKQEGAGTLPAARLCDYVRLLPPGDVACKVQESHFAGFSAGKNKARIAGMSRESFPEIPEMPQPVAELPVQALAALIGRVAFAVSQEESRFTLNGALLLLDSEGMTLVATDGHRLAFAKRGVATCANALKLLLPARAMKEIVKLGADASDEAVLQFAQDENHLFFRIWARLLIVRKLTGNFPDYARVLPSGEASVAKVDRAALLSALARVSEFADETSQACHVLFASGSLRVSASCVDAGESEEACDCEYVGPEIEIGFNAAYLMQFLSESPGQWVQFRVTNEKSAGELRPDALGVGEEYRYVVMPMRV